MKRPVYKMLNVGESIFFEENMASDNEKIVSIQKDKATALSFGTARIYDERGELRAVLTVDWQVQNPVLPYSWNLPVPDAEAHVFDDTVYVFGSLDGVAGRFCSPDYVSLFTKDLQKWESGGVIFSSNWLSDENRGRNLWAPDVCKFKEKYFMYTWFEPVNNEEYMFVVESESPDGKYGNFRWIVNEKGQKVRGGDPAVFVEGGKRYLFWGTPDTPPADGGTDCGQRYRQQDIACFRAARFF